MVIVLKFILLIITIVCVIFSYFAIREYKIWFKSEESQEASIFERLLVNLMTFGILIVFVLISIFSIIFLFSKIAITMPL